jgi:hypothetical protein
VLQRVQAVIGEVGDVLVRGPDTEHAARVTWRPVLGKDFIRETTVGGCH